MTFDRLRGLVQDKRELVPVVLLTVAVLLGVLSVAKATGFFIASARAERIVKEAIARSKPDPSVVERQVARSKPVAEDLKRKNLFSPPPPKEHPVKAVFGIFGDEAFINGKWYKAGAKIADAKIVAIGPDSVTTEWDGKEKVFRPIDAEGTPAPGGKSRPGRPAPKPGATGGGPADMVVVQSEGPPRRGPERGGPGGPGGMRGRFSEMSEADRDRMRARMQDARERYSQMSEAEREKFRAEMRERFGGGRDGRGGPGGRGGRGGR